jgi:uncharacterized protein (DUF342 family)
MDQIAHCNVQCEGSLLVGTNGGKGQILGGRLSALREVQARILGSVSEATTIVEAGSSGTVQLQKTRADDAAEKIRLELERIEKELKALGEAGKDSSRAKALKEKQATCSGRMDELRREQEEIEKKLSFLSKAKIKAAQVHHGVTLRIGESKRTFDDIGPSLATDCTDFTDQICAICAICG